MNTRQAYKPKLNVKLKNQLTNEVVTVDVVQEESIEDKHFWVVKSNNRTLKLAKDAYTIVKSK